MKETKTRSGAAGRQAAEEPARAPAAGHRSPASTRQAAADERGARGSDLWDLRLYVAGQTPRSLAAFDNLTRLCEEHLPGKYRIEVVDLLENPRLAKDDQILAIPTLVRKLPPPIRKVIGDLSNRVSVLVGLQLRSRG